MPRPTSPMLRTIPRSVALVFALAAFVFVAPAALFAQVATTATVTVFDGDTGSPAAAQVQITYSNGVSSPLVTTGSGVAEFSNVLPGLFTTVHVTLTGSGRTDTKSVPTPGFTASINNLVEVVVAPTLGSFSAGVEGQIWQQMAPFGQGLEMAPTGFTCTNDFATSPAPVTTCALPGGGTTPLPPLGLVAFPLGMAIDPSNGITYVSDNYNNRIQAFTTNPTTFDVAPLPFTVPIGNGEPAQGTYGPTVYYGGSGSLIGTVQGGERLSQPRGIKVDAAHRIIVADYWNGRVAVFQGCVALAADGTCDLSRQPSVGGASIADGTFLFDFTLASVGTYPARATGIGLTPGATVTNGKVNDPANAQRLIVTDDWNGVIYVFNSDLYLIDTFTPGSTPTGVAFDRTGHFFVADQSGFVSVHALNGAMLGSFGLAVADPITGAVTLAPGDFMTPWDVLVDQRGRIVVSDRDNQRLNFYDVTIAGTPPVVTANFLYFVDAADFNGYPAGMVEDTVGGLDPSGKIYATDVGNNRVQRFQMPDLAVVEASAALATHTGSFSVVVPVGKLRVAGVTTTVTPTIGTVGPLPVPTSVPWIFPGQSVPFTFGFSDPATFAILAVGNRGATTSNAATATATAPCGAACSSSASVVALGGTLLRNPALISPGWYNTSVTVRISATSTTGLASIRYVLGGVQAGSEVSTSRSGSTGFVDVVINANGFTTLQYWAVNADGTEEPHHTGVSIALDLDPPSIVYDFAGAVPHSSGIGPDGSVWWNAPAVSVPFTFYDATTGATATWPTSNVVTVPRGTTGAGTLTLSQASTGRSVKGLFETVTVTDSASNAKACGSNDAYHCLGMPVNIDTVKPTLTTRTLPTALTLELTAPGGAQLPSGAFQAQATDDTGGSGVASVNNPTAGASGPFFPLGVTTWSFFATDYAGNVSTLVTRTITVRDTTPPTLNVPGPLTVLSATGAVVTFAVTATDLGDPSPTISCTSSPVTGLVSGSTFPVGTTTITCKATDHSAYPSPNTSAPRTFTVTVRSANAAPVCTAAVASPAVIWPPNHKLVPISISGVTHPDGNPVTLKVLKIFQDEPTTGSGDGSTMIDASGVGTSQAFVRSERSGNGDGRVYYISFSATDPSGESCTGTATVAVPHDMAHPAAGQGQLYDSTVPSPAVVQGGHDDGKSDSSHK